jgi:hypothetical protein
MTAGTVTLCQHCERRIVNIDGAWVDPEATGDDSTWRETCDRHDTFIAEHEPAPNPTATPPGPWYCGGSCAPMGTHGERLPGAQIVGGPDTGWGHAGPDGAELDASHAPWPLFSVRGHGDHGSRCHCGKWAKAHADTIAAGGACFNVCGTHANVARRQGGTVTDGTVSVCDTCHVHTVGGVSSFGIGTGERSFECHECHDRRCGTCAGRGALRDGSTCYRCHGSGLSADERATMAAER